MNNQEYPRNPQAMEGADDIDSTEKHFGWTVMRMKRRNCACYPIRLAFETAHSEAEVREQIAQWVRLGHIEWKEFQHFDLWPALPTTANPRTRRRHMKSTQFNHLDSCPQ